MVYEIISRPGPNFSARRSLRRIPLLALLPWVQFAHGPNAEAAAEKALEMDDSLAEAHTSLGLIKATLGNDEADIEKEYKRAIELNANYATAHHWYALHLNDVHRFDEAIAEIRRAREIDPCRWS